MDDIFTRQPVNRQAAVVVGQSGCEEDLSIDQKRECLISRLAQIDRQLDGLPKKHRYRKDLGQERQALQLDISRINKQIKRKRMKDRGLNEYIIEECRANMPRYKWLEILAKARAAKELSDAHTIGE